MRLATAALLMTALGAPLSARVVDLPGLLPASVGAGSGPISAPDTVVEARTGDELLIETWRGSLSVRVGDDDLIRVTDMEHGGGAVVSRDGALLRVRPARRDAEGDLVLEVPAWMTLRVRSRELDVNAEGLAGGVRIEVLEGDVRLHAIAGPVEVETMDGEVEVRDVEGPVRLRSLDGDIQLRGARGDRISLESTDGELEVEDVEADEILAVTVDGDIHFHGRIAPGGSLTLTTHDGDVRARLPAALSAAVQVSTFDGSFESDFPVRTRGFRAGEPLRFTVGEGATRVVLESFDGDIRLLSW